MVVTDYKRERYMLLNTLQDSVIF